MKKALLILVFLLLPIDLFAYLNEKVTNGTFVSDISSWSDISTGSGTIAYSSGTMEITGDDTGYGWAEQALTVTAEHHLGMFFDVSDQAILVRVGTTSGAADVFEERSFATGSDQRFNFNVPAATTTIYFQLRNQSTSTATIDNVSVKESHLNYWAGLAPSNFNETEGTCSGTACGGATVYKAADCQLSSFSTAFSSMESGGGGIILIPTGDCETSNNWTSNYYDNNCEDEFYVIGMGETATKIKDDYNSSNAMLLFAPGGTNPTGFRGIAHIKFTGRNATPSMFLQVRGAENAEIVIKNLTLYDFGESLGRLTGMFGVLHNITHESPFDGDTGQHAYAWTIENSVLSGQEFPSTLPSLGTRAALFIEDCTFDNYGHSAAGFCLSSIVFRNNTLTNVVSGSAVDVHDPGYNGCWPSFAAADEHGGRVLEVYDNSFSGVDTLGGQGVRPRSGGGVIYDNSFEDMKHGIQLYLGANSGGPLCDDGTCTWDYDYDNGNCTDAGDGCCQGTRDFWVWDNSYTNVGTNFQIEDDVGGCMVEDDEYYLEEKSGYTAYQYPHPLNHATSAGNMTFGGGGSTTFGGSGSTTIGE